MVLLMREIARDVGLTRAFAGTTAHVLAIGAEYAASILSQVLHAGLPIMLSPAPVLAAWAAQPDLLAAFVQESCWLLALVEGGVPPLLDDVVVKVRQRPLATRSTCIFAKQS